MEKLLRTLLFVMALAVTADPAFAGWLRVSGTAGYLSEWQLDGNVTERISAGVKEYFGPLTWKHVGVCSPNGPQEKSGEIRFHISGSGAISHIRANLSLDGARCTYAGDWSGNSSGLMDCSDAKGIPLTLSFK